MVTLLAISVRVLGLRRTFRLVNRLFRGQLPDRCVDFRYLETVAHRIAAIAAFLPGRVRCLEQSLTLYTCLRRLHIDVSLQVGVQPYPFLAHAWVEYRGQPVAETWDKVSTFVPIAGWQS
jgi:transglutaminase superfamily protein